MYRHLSLVRLAELIAHNSDRKALQELHNNRTMFYYHSDRPLHLAEFTDKLRQSKQGWRWCNQNAEILERAYDLTISKFINLPDQKKTGQDVKLDGPDCRYYFEAFVRHAKKKVDTESYNNEAEREIQMAGLLQNLVIRHFRLSCQECCRRVRELTRRYLWKLDGYTVSVMLPIQIPGSQCSKWLTDNIPDIDPSRPGERDRVQAVVDRLLTRQKVVSLENVDKSKIAANPPCLQPEIEQEMTVRGLADVVADEKAENISFQRTVIQQLGKDKLRQLIHHIFDSLTRGEYEAMNTADSFGINRVTFSRFAGSCWLIRAGKNTNLPVPDLWRNTARTLAGHPMFVRVAETTGVLERVEEILEGKNAQRSRT